jgi:hypothetical protein
LNLKILQIKDDIDKDERERGILILIRRLKPTAKDKAFNKAAWNIKAISFAVHFSERTESVK